MLIVALAIGIAWIDCCATQPGRALEPDQVAGSGHIVRAEVLHLWLPETLIDLAKHVSGSSVAQSHQELRTSLERSGQENLWFAFTIRAHQVNGVAADITFIRHPYREPEDFREFLDILATAAGSPPDEPPAYYSGAEVHILPQELTEREPRAVVEELLSMPYLPSELSRESNDGRNQD